MQRQENNIKIYDHNSMKRVFKYFYYPLFLFNNAVINKIPSRHFRKWCYKLLGARIRKNAFLFRRVEVLFPKGLYIGTIVSIHQDDNDFVKYAVIRPGVDFSKLEEVFVITHSTDNSSYEKPDVSPKLVPQTQRDKVEGVKGAAAL